MTTSTDTELRDALAPLREDTPTDAEVAALVARHRAGRAQRARTQRLKIALPTIAVATACVVAALAFLPAGDTTPSRPGQQPSAHSILTAASATAAEQPADGGFGGFRYTRTLYEQTQRIANPPKERGKPWTIVATITDRQVWEQWVDADWNGRQTTHQGEIVHLTGTSPKLLSQLRKHPGIPAGTRPLPHDDNPLRNTSLRQLPTDPKQLAALLHRVLYPINQPPGIPGPNQERYDLVRLAVDLISRANATPQLRAAGFGVLADLPGAVSLGPTKDRLGRTGTGVQIPVKGNRGGQFGPDTRITIVFNEQTTELLQFQDVIGGGSNPSGETLTFLQSGRVAKLGAKP